MIYFSIEGSGFRAMFWSVDVLRMMASCQVAYHEAGHAVTQHYLRPDERIVRVSIIRRSG